jgi:hypothetical protein
MPVVYVANWEPASHTSARTSACEDRTVYQLIIPRRDHATSTWRWDELDVRPSGVHGLGVYPRACDALDWSNLRMPVLLPYLGLESVVEDLHLHKCLLAILHGEFVSLTVREVRARHGGTYARNGICAVRIGAAAAAPAQRRPAHREALGDDERLLQVLDSSTSSGGAVYLLEADARQLLHLHERAPTPPTPTKTPAAAANGGCGVPVGGHGHLFELLAAHERLHHADRHLATHVATIKRDEGWVIVNAHPAIGDGLNCVGIINEPVAKAKPTLKLVHRSVELLDDDCAELRRLGLRQPPGAAECWRAAILPHDPRAPAADARAWRLAERMVVYCAARRAYPLEQELTVDYGRSYRREYASGEHKPHARFAAARTAAAAAGQSAAAAALRAHAAGGEAFAAGARDEWPTSLRGWWNPLKQPLGRPAFRLARGGRVALLDDLPHLVAAQRALSAPCEARRADGGAEGCVSGAVSVADGALPTLAAPRRALAAPPPRVHPRSRAAAALGVDARPTVATVEQAAAEGAEGMLPARFSCTRVRELAAPPGSGTLGGFFAVKKRARDVDAERPAALAKRAHADLQNSRALQATVEI